jgi:phosphonate dehydrogenase
MTRPHVVITHWVHPEVVEFLSERCQVSANPTRKTRLRGEVLRMAKNADALMAFMPDIVDEQFLNACPRLKVVAAALKGYDNFDVPAMTRRGIWFTIVPDLLTAPTAELAVALLLGLTRRVLEGDEFVRGGDFRGWRPELYGADLSERLLGIVGMGAVGRAIALRLAGFGMEIHYYDSRRLRQSEEIDLGLNYLPLDELLSLSDFVILCVPLAANSFHLLNERTLAAMKPGSYLVNIGRGSVVDEQAVARALDSGQLGGYAADVFELEDAGRLNRPDSIPPTLLQNRSKTLFTPHLGSAVADVRRKIELRAALNILEALRGEIPRDAVNRPSRVREISPSL